MVETLGKIGIDLSSVLIYVVDIGVLFGVIAYFVTGPVLNMMDSRRNIIKDNLEQAERIKQEFQKEREHAEKEKKAFRQDMEHQMMMLQKNLEEKRKTQEEALSLKKAKMMEEIRSMMEEEKKSLIQQAEKDVLQLIAKVISHIVSNKIPQEIVKESVEESWKNFSHKKS